MKNDKRKLIAEAILVAIGGTMIVVTIIFAALWAAGVTLW